MHGLCSPPPTPPYRSSVHICRSWPTQCFSPMLLTLHRLKTKGALLIGLSWSRPKELGIREATSRNCSWRCVPPSPSLLLSFQSGWVAFSSLLLFVRLTGPSKVWPSH